MELRHFSERDAIQMVNAVLDLEINDIDSSPDYGLSEELIGKAVAHRRDEFFMASKCGCNVDALGKGQTPSHVAENIRAALAGPLPAAIYQEPCRRLATVGSLPQEI